MRGKGNRGAVTVGIWRNGSKNGIGAEKKPVELGNQIKRQKMERLSEGWRERKGGRSGPSVLKMEELEVLKMREAGKIK